MRTLMVFLAVSAAVAVLIAGTIAAVLVQLIPSMLIAAVIVVGVLSLRRRPASRPVYHRPALPPPPPIGGHRWDQARAAAPPQGVWCSVAPPGWVMVPVWIGPLPPRLPASVIDAEVIEDDRRG